MVPLLNIIRRSFARYRALPDIGFYPTSGTTGHRVLPDIGYYRTSDTTGYRVLRVSDIFRSFFFPHRSSCCEK